MAQLLNGDFVENCLTKYPTIVEPILSNLNAKDLSSASCVCSFWHETAKRIWQRRKIIVTKLSHKPEGEENEGSMHEMGTDLCMSINGSFMYPSVAFMYLSRCDEYFSKSHAKHIQKVTKNVKKSLPKKCILTGGLGGGVIGCNALKSQEVEQCEAISSLLLPQRSDIFVKDFFITMSDVAAAGKSVEKWQNLLGCPKNWNVKLVLLNVCCEANGVEATVKMIIKSLGKDVLIAGGLAESIIHGDKLRKRGISGMLFAGNLEASLVMHKTRRNNEGVLGKDREKFIENLQELKASIGVDGYNVIFMYSCVARGVGLYSENSMQTKWISEVFPGIPVIGMFAFGEIGYGPGLSETFKTGFHAYSTVLCLCKF